MFEQVVKFLYFSWKFSSTLFLNDELLLKPGNGNIEIRFEVLRRCLAKGHNSWKRIKTFKTITSCPALRGACGAPRLILIFPIWGTKKNHEQNSSKKPRKNHQQSKNPSKIHRPKTIKKHTFSQFLLFTNLSKLLQTDQRRSETIENTWNSSKKIKNDQENRKRSKVIKVIKNDQGLWKTIKSDQKSRKTIKNFLNLHFPKKWPRTIWNHSESFLELLKTFFKLFVSKRQSNSFENPLQGQTLNASTALTKDFEKRSKVIKKIEKRSKFF